MSLKNKIKLGTACAGSFAAGAYKGYADANGIDLSWGLNTALIFGPIPTSFFIGTTEETEREKYRGGNHIAAGIGMAFEGLEALAIGVGYSAFSLVCQSVGYGTGYLMGR